MKDAAVWRDKEGKRRMRAKLRDSRSVTKPGRDPELCLCLQLPVLAQLPAWEAPAHALELGLS